MTEELEGAIFAAVVEVTNRCNFRCPFCASDSGCARENEMSFDEMRGVVRDLASLGCREFTMLGGEFLLRSDWYEIGKMVKDAGMELQLITNGLLVTEEHRRQFKALDPQMVCVLLDGATPVELPCRTGRGRVCEVSSAPGRSRRGRFSRGACYHDVQCEESRRLRCLC